MRQEIKMMFVEVTSAKSNDRMLINDKYICSVYQSAKKGGTVIETYYEELITCKEPYEDIKKILTGGR